MHRDTSKLSQNEYDLLVIGGGINGAAIAYAATSRGLSVCLLEKGDFASGTSSKSTKLIHGGIRYLENGEFDLVQESLKERYIQLRSAPHLVRPISFIIPIYRGDKRSLWMMRLGTFIYDKLAGQYNIHKHNSLNKNEVLKLIPNLKKEGLLGGIQYFDAQMDDARLCLENILSAADKGAQAANYVQVNSFIKVNGKAVGVHAKDLMTGNEFSVEAKKIICAVGPWANQLVKLDNINASAKIRITKGIHIVYQGEISKSALLLPVQRDNRIFFIIPFMGNSLIGTTDTDYSDDLDNLRAEQNEIDYLFTEAKRILPEMHFAKEKIITTFAGLRPLVLQDKKLPSKVSRKAGFFMTDSGIMFVIGGKYTTYRKIAQDCVDVLTPIRQQSSQSQENYPLYGTGKIYHRMAELADLYHVSSETARAITEKYGSRYLDVLKLTVIEDGLREPLCSCTPFIKAQVVYAIETEGAQTPEDVIERRLGLHFIPCPTRKCQSVIKEMFDEYK